MQLLLGILLKLYLVVIGIKNNGGLIRIDRH